MAKGTVVGLDPRTPQDTGAGGRFERAPIRGARIRPGGRPLYRCDRMKHAAQ